MSTVSTGFTNLNIAADVNTDLNSFSFGVTSVCNGSYAITNLEDTNFALVTTGTAVVDTITYNVATSKYDVVLSSPLVAADTFSVQTVDAVSGAKVTEDIVGNLYYGVSNTVVAV